MGTLHALKKRHLRIVELPESAERLSAWPSLAPRSWLEGYHPTALGVSEASSQKRAVLKLGSPEAKGIPVSLQIGNEGALDQLEATGWLPPATELLAAQADWQQA